MPCVLYPFPGINEPGQPLVSGTPESPIELDLNPPLGEAQTVPVKGTAHLGDPTNPANASEMVAGWVNWPEPEGTSLDLLGIQDFGNADDSTGDIQSVGIIGPGHGSHPLPPLHAVATATR